MNIVYLDWAAAAIPDREIIEKSGEICLAHFGNPSSPHTLGTASRDVLENFRSRLGTLLGCSEQQLVLTSGGSESNNTVLRSLLGRKKKPSIVLSGMEHSSVYETARHLGREGCELRIVKAQRDGFIKAGDVADAVDETTGLVCIIHVSNETGAIQPIRGIVEKVRAKSDQYTRNVHIHTDAVQSAGKIPIRLVELGVDSASMSSHKFCGPRGAGLLYVRSSLNSLISGGDQEHCLRAGTENLSGLAGMTLALEKRVFNMEEEFTHVETLKAKVFDCVQSIGGAISLGESTEGYSPYIINVMFPPIPAEVLMRVLNDRGFAVATGSACSSKKSKKTRVLENLGYNREEASSAIRISFGHSTRVQDVERFCTSLKESVEILKNAVLS